MAQNDFSGFMEFVDSVYSDMEDVVSASEDCRWNPVKRSLDFYDSEGEFVNRHICMDEDCDFHAKLCLALAMKFYDVPLENVREFAQNFFYSV